MEKYPALLIEDDQNWRNYFKEIVEKDSRNCFEFHYAENLKQGLSFISQYPYSLILLDLMLPDGQDYEHTITSVVGASNYTPIIILTMLADKKMEEFAFGQGIEDYLKKDEYDEKVFFHVARSAINKGISKIQQEFYENLQSLLDKLKNISTKLDQVIGPTDGNI